MNLGVFGGTFDPPHLGHLILAEAARDQLQLDKVLWVVAGQSPLKQDRQISPAEIRVEMVLAAIADNPALALSRVDLDRPAPHYTVDTLKLLRRESPDAELYFLMGEDSLRDLPRWRSPGEIIGQAWLAVSQRPGTEFDLSDLESAVPGVSARVKWVQAPQLEIASSDIQRRIREGRTVRYMLPPEVRKIIHREKLYRK
ncbi:MAG: nicotinate-nucleotide adenylyltransferase [Chloroflexota bacterium]